MPDVQRSERGPTRIEVAAIQNEDTSKSRVLVTMTRQAAGLKAGEAVMMSSYLSYAVACALRAQLDDAIGAIQ